MRFVFYVAETAGFCWGVKRAIQGAEGKERKAGEPIYVLGQLVYNEDAVRDLEEKHIHVVRDVEEARGKTLLITAHGKAPREVAYAKTVAADVLDMKCPIVQDLHEAALELKEEGRKVILIIGPKQESHVEVLGVVGVLEGDVVLVQSPCDIEALEFHPQTMIGIVAQTTVNEFYMHELVRIIKDRFQYTKFVPTLCDDISRKQAELRSRGKKFDMILVVGDTKSANTKELFMIARDELKKPTLFILNEAELKKKDIYGVRKIFVIAGALTPLRSIEGVVQRLQEWGGVRKA